MTEEELKQGIEATLVHFTLLPYTLKTRDDMINRLTKLFEEHTPNPDLWNHITIAVSKPGVNRSISINLIAQTPTGEAIIKKMRGES
jgi:hypothetical protein